MRNKAGLIISLILSCSVIIFGFRIYEKIGSIRSAEKSISVLPGFSFTTLDNRPYTNKDLYTAGNKVIVGLFSPDCEHCQYMAASYLKNKDRLGKNLTILWVTTADSGSVARFNDACHLNAIPNLILLRDPHYTSLRIFYTSMIPSFFIYTGGRLTKKIIGETTIDNLLSP